MQSRTQKILQLAKREVENHLLDLPKYETTKGTSREQQLAILNTVLPSQKPVAHVTPIKRLSSQECDISSLYGYPSNDITDVNYSQSPLVNEELATSLESSHFSSYSGSEYKPSKSDNSFNSNSTDSKSCFERNYHDITIFEENLTENRNNFQGNFYSPETSNTIEKVIEGMNKIDPMDRKEVFKKKSVAAIKQLTSEYQKNLENLLETDSNANTEGITLHTSTLNGKRMRNKYHSCYFCEKLIINISRHLETVHGTDIAVAKVLAMPKKSKQRRDAFEELIKTGDFYYNCNILAVKKGSLLLVRRPSEHTKPFVTYLDYGPCPECLGFMLKRELWRHVKTACNKMKSILNDSTTKRRPISESNALLRGIFGTGVSSTFITNIVEQFNNDRIANTCQEDQLILQFGCMNYEKYGNTQSELIRQNMRQLGRFLIEVKKVDPEIKTLSECFVPNKFDTVIQATKIVCVNHTQNVQRPEFKIPSLTLKIGYALHKCAAILRGKALREGDLKQNEKTVGFVNLLDMEWSIRISSNALSTLYRRKLNVNELLPLTSDLVKLSNYLEREMQYAEVDLEKSPSPKHWARLAIVTLSRIILFNKRRSGEAAKITLLQYSARPSWLEHANKELYQSLSEFEKNLASKLLLLETEGKRGKKVPVLLTADMKNSIDTLIKTRGAVNVRDSNPYIFARPNSTSGHLRGHDCLRSVCEESSLESPEYITGTKLRKYVATVCQIFNMKENETDWLARHLGHDVKVHREFYRLHENAVELTKISRLLLAIDQGEANKFAGKSLEDISIRDLPDVNYDSGNQDIDEEVEEHPEYSLLSSNKKKVPRNGTASQKLEPSRNKFRKRETVQSQRKPWTSKEKDIVLQTFRLEIKKEILPGKAKCTDILDGNKDIFRNRKWTDIKFFIKNYITQLKKKTNAKLSNKF